MQKISLNLFLCVMSVLLLVAFSLPLQTNAARIFLETPQKAVGIGQRFEVSVYTHSEGEVVNAFEGIIRIPSFVTALSINDGNSIVALWSRRPEIEGSEIVFAGITPGGWRGPKGFLFSFTVEASAVGDADIDLANTLVLLHDGKGTPASLSVEALSLSVNAGIPLTEFTEEIDDQEPPEAFTLEIEHDPELFSGDAFLVFAAQDKGSGIDHYEILETQKKLHDETKGEWKHAESPYRLHDQSLKSFVYVRAVDRAGNVRVSVYEPEDQKETSSSSAFIVLALILFFVLGVFFLRRKHL